MARKATGQVLERIGKPDKETGKRRRVFALRFRALGGRQYVTLGAAPEWNRALAEQELQSVLAAVLLRIWRPPAPEPAVSLPDEEPTFHEYASRWLEDRKPELRERSVEALAWALSCHLLAYFASFRLSAITIAEVHRYRSAKLREREGQLVDRPLSNSSINRSRSKSRGGRGSSSPSCARCSMLRVTIGRCWRRWRSLACACPRSRVFAGATFNSPPVGFAFVSRRPRRASGPLTCRRICSMS
jgi:hypothetical protein